jgi:hypothetical protein
MNAIRLSALFAKPAANPARVPANLLSTTTRTLYRERDFGIGYGNSSGYATDRRYTSEWGPTRFRCA